MVGLGSCRGQSSCSEATASLTVGRGSCNCVSFCVVPGTLPFILCLDSHLLVLSPVLQDGCCTGCDVDTIVPDNTCNSLDDVDCPCTLQARSQTDSDTTRHFRGDADCSRGPESCVGFDNCRGLDDAIINQLACRGSSNCNSVTALIVGTEACVGDQAS